MSEGGDNIDTSSDAIRFVLDGELYELDNIDPTRTVLQFLREDLGRTGTKEGCAEGDCGACTVVLAELNKDGSDLTVRAINSCIQFLPTLDGKELITVESLGRDGNLHPAQQAMVDHHGSQCGFCTPGMLLQAKSFLDKNPKPSREGVIRALSPNLCRCTGYKKIVEAVMAAAEITAAPESDMKPSTGHYVSEQEGGEWYSQGLTVPLSGKEKR